MYECRTCRNNYLVHLHYCFAFRYSELEKNEVFRECDNISGRIKSVTNFSGEEPWPRTPPTCQYLTSLTIANLKHQILQLENVHRSSNSPVLKLRFSQRRFPLSKWLPIEYHFYHSLSRFTAILTKTNTGRAKFANLPWRRSSDCWCVHQLSH